MDDLARQIRAWADAAAPGRDDAVTSYEVSDRQRSDPPTGRQRTVAMVLAMAVVALVVGVGAVALSRRDGSGTVRTSGGGESHEAPPWAPIPMAGDPPRRGTALGNGFSVPEGAFLVGGPIALGVGTIYNNVPLIDKGWEAYLEVPGDPRSVMEVVRRQADAVGLPLHPMAIDDGDPAAFCGPDAEGYSCLAAAAADRGRDDHRRLDVSFVRTHGGGAEAPQSYLRIKYSDRERPSGPPGALGDVNAPLGPPPNPVSTSWPALAKTNESFGEGYGDGIAGFTVEPGSQLLAPVTSEPFDGCTAEAYVALLAIDGDPQEVLRAYAEQADAHVEPVPATVPADPLRVDNGSRVTVAYTGAPGGDSYDLRLIEPEVGTPLLQITTCYD